MKTFDTLKPGDVIYNIFRQVYDEYELVVKEVCVKSNGDIHITFEGVDYGLNINRSETSRTYKALSSDYIYVIKETEKRNPSIPTSLTNIGQDSLVYCIRLLCSNEGTYSIVKKVITVSGVCITPEVILIAPQDKNDSPLLIYSSCMRREGKLSVDPSYCVVGTNKDEVEEEFSKVIKDELNFRLERISELEQEAIKIQSLLDLNESQKFIENEKN